MIIKRCVVCGKRLINPRKTTRTCGSILCMSRWYALLAQCRKQGSGLTPDKIAVAVKKGRMKVPLSWSIVSTAMRKAVRTGRAEETEELKPLLATMPKPVKEEANDTKMSCRLPKPTRICHGWTDADGRHHACAHSVRTWDYQCPRCRANQRAAYDVPQGMDDSEV